MSKKTKEEPKDVSAVSGQADTSHLVKTFAITNPEFGVYHIHEVTFDPNANIIKTLTNRDEANETFKIAVANTGMLGW